MQQLDNAVNSVSGPSCGSSSSSEVAHLELELVLGVCAPQKDALQNGLQVCSHHRDRQSHGHHLHSSDCGRHSQGMLTRGREECGAGRRRRRARGERRGEDGRRGREDGEGRTNGSHVHTLQHSLQQCKCS